jgi:hypothetical protein
MQQQHKINIATIKTNTVRLASDEQLMKGIQNPEDSSDDDQSSVAIVSSIFENITIFGFRV